MITVKGTLSCATAAEADIVRAFLPDHIRMSRAEPGCMTFNVEATADPFVWQLDETFIDRKAFEAHQSRTRASVWYAATEGLTRDFHVADISE